MLEQRPCDPNEFKRVARDVQDHMVKQKFTRPYIVRVRECVTRLWPASPFFD